MSNYALPISALAIPDGTITIPDMASTAKPPSLHSYLAATAALTTAETFQIGHASDAGGYIPFRACNVKRLYVCATAASPVGSPTVAATLRKNTNTGAGGNILVATSGVLVAGFASWSSTTIVVSGAMNGSTDFYTLSLKCAAGTSVTLTFITIVIEAELV